MKAIKTQFVKIITVIDPDTGAEIELEIRKMETGGMIGLDGSWIDEEKPTYSPYDKNVKIDID